MVITEDIAVSEAKARARQAVLALAEEERAELIKVTTSAASEPDFSLVNRLLKGKYWSAVDTALLYYHSQRTLPLAGDLLRALINLQQAQQTQQAKERKKR